MGKHEAGYARVERDFYRSPPWVVAALGEHVELAGARVWEPACGDGRMAEALKAAGASVYASDIEDRGYVGFDAALDFLVASPPAPFDKIITNPPYGKRNKTAERFIERGLLHIAAAGGVLALLLPNDFDAAKTRRHLFADCPHFVAKIVLTRRVKWFEPPPGEPDGSPKENHAWFLWRRRPRARVEHADPSVRTELQRRRVMSGRARLGHRRRRDGRTASWPDTDMARAFLVALARWAVAHHDDGNATIMLPTGAATAEELMRVLRGLELARRAAS